MRLLLICAAAAILAGSGSAAPAAEPAPAPLPPKPVISVKSYWRHHQTYYNFQAVDKAGNLFNHVIRRYSSNNNPWLGNLIRSEEPPAGWEKPDFDDSGWSVQRMPFGLAPSYELRAAGEAAGNMVPWQVRRYAFRARFLVPDPARVTSLKLRLGYAGGVIACVNGREVGRGGVAKDGSLAQGGYGELYPELAYGPQTDRQKQLDRRFSLWSAPDETWRWTKDAKTSPEEQAEIRKALADLAAARRRVLEVEVPREALVRGVNVLTLDSRLSPLSGPHLGAMPNWNHSGVEEVALAAEPAGAALPDAGPEKPQVWVEDVHRWMRSPDHLEAGVRERRAMEVVGARGGTFSGQAVVRAAGAALGAPQAAVGELVGPGGAKLPAGAVRVRWARGVSLYQHVFDGGSGFFGRQGPKLDLSRYSANPEPQFSRDGRANRSEHKEHNDPALLLFDQLAADPPASIPAGTCQPLWLTVSVPRDAAPGEYRGVLTVRAGGLAEEKIDVLLRVSAFALPEPRDFVGYTGVDESPWALAKGCKLELWSDRHWKLVEESLARAGELGARVVGLPVIQDTELNNGKDTVVRWAKKGDGYEYDFALADRYLDLWKKSCHAQSDVIVYLVQPANEHGKGGGTGTVLLADGGGAPKEFRPPTPATPEGLKLWVAFARAVREHLNAKGFRDEHIHWGLFYDFCSEDTNTLAEALAKECPGVGWATSHHEPRNPFTKGSPARLTWNTCVRGYAGPFNVGPAAKTADGQSSWDYAKYAVSSGMGWKDPANLIVLTRADTGITALGGMYSPLWQIRQLQETAVSARNCRGVGRICVDGWGRSSYFGPFIPSLLYPGKEGGLDGSAQFEMLREGFQEAEARIALEKRGGLAADVQKVLDRRLEWSWTLPCYPWARIAEFTAGWQERSLKLYEAAGK